MSTLPLPDHCRAVIAAYHNALTAALIAERDDLVARAVRAVEWLGVKVWTPKSVTGLSILAAAPEPADCWMTVNLLRQVEREARPTQFVEPAPLGLDALGELMRRAG